MAVFQKSEGKKRAAFYPISPRLTAFGCSNMRTAQCKFYRHFRDYCAKIPRFY